MAKNYSFIHKPYTLCVLCVLRGEFLQCSHGCKRGYSSSYVTPNHPLCRLIPCRADTSELGTCLRHTSMLPSSLPLGEEEGEGNATSILSQVWLVYGVMVGTRLPAVRVLVTPTLPAYQMPPGSTLLALATVGPV